MQRIIVYIYRETLEKYVKNMSLSTKKQFKVLNRKWASVIM